MTLKTMSYKPAFSVLEFVFGLIGPAIIAITILFPLDEMKVGTLRLDLPPGVANGILAAIGILATFLTVSTLVKKRAARSNGGQIVLTETSLTFTRVRGFKGVLTTVNFDDISKVAITTGEENTVTLWASTLNPAKVSFDADNMHSTEEFSMLVDTVKRHADNAAFSLKEVSA